MTHDDGMKADPDHHQEDRGDEEQQEARGEQGTSSGDPHDDTDPQSG